MDDPGSPTFRVDAATVGDPGGLVGGREVLDTWGAHVAVLDEHGRVLVVNDAWERYAHDNDGHGVGVGANYFEVCEAAAVVEPAAGATLEGARAVLDGSSPEFVLEYPSHSPTAQQWFRVRVRTIEVSGLRRLLVSHEDVTDHKRIQDDVRVRSLLLDEVEAAVIATDIDGVVTLWNRGAERSYGWTAEHAVGMPIAHLTVGAQLGDLLSDAGERGSWEGRLTVARRDGSTFVAYVRSTLLRDVDGRPSGVIGVSVDMTEQVAMTNDLARSNRQLRAITHSIGEGLCTLDARGRITYINPHALKILRLPLYEALGEPLMEWLESPAGPRPSGGVPVETDPERPVQCQMFRGDGSEVPVEYVASSLVDAPDSEPGWVVVFRDVSDRRAREVELSRQVDEAFWRDRIRAALDADGFVLHAQPIVELATGRTVQHELLLRMRDPDAPDVLIAPSRFLPTAETVGLAPAIDRWVLARGLELAATGHPVEINLSARSLDDPTLPDLIERLLQDTGADPATVVFEITETALIENDVIAHRFAERIRGLGCKVAFDDFGTGYGGFSYLKQLPLDYLKIDTDFVGDLLRDPASRHVVEAVVSLARAFGMQTVAEGVEDQPTLALLSELGVDFAQGFHLGPPAPLPPTPADQAGGRP